MNQRKTYLAIWLLLLCQDSRADLYSECIAERMPGAKTDMAARAIAATCEKQTMPKKCSGPEFEAKIDQRMTEIKQSTRKRLEEQKRQTGNVTPLGEIPLSDSYISIVVEYAGRNDSSARKELLRKCIDECSRANYFSRKFGACATEF